MKLTADFRSDTVTRPSPAMLEAMFDARVGDDVFGEDPTIIELEERSARMFSQEAGLFCPSGTMANQIAVRMHTSIQDEIICDKLSHIYFYEAGGIASNSGVSVRLVDGDRGRMSAGQVREVINHGDNIHLPVSRMVAVENTSNKGGGSYYSLDELREIGKVAKENGLAYHLDGARIFNALEETKDSPQETGALFDSVSVCLSKGLGAPVGSMLLGKKKQIEKAKRIRKAFGGGMRQAGFLAAAGLYALENNIGRLKEDHSRAKEIGEALGRCSYVDELMPVETNIIVFRLNDKISMENFLEYLKERNILAVPFGKQLIRMVTHLDIDDVMTGHAIDSLMKFPG